MTAAATRRANRDIDALVAALRARFCERVTTAASVLEQHGRDESYHTTRAARRGRVRPIDRRSGRSRQICGEYKIPLIAYGTGTSLEGHVAALEGGICLDVSQMNKVLRVSPEDLDCTVECGVTRKQLNDYLRDTGCSSRSIRAPTRPSAAWRRRARRARMPCATAPCATMSCRSK